MPLDVDQFDALTFDCYGTLVDWATGISTALQPILRAHDVEIDDEELFRLYARFEKDVESGRYVEYREVLRRVTRRFGDQFDFTPTNAEVERFADSVGDWPLFPDTNEVLRRLNEHFRLAIVSNVDDDLFRDTARHFRVDFDDVITGEQVRTYKPDLQPFETAFTRLGVPPNRLLHVAQSVYHDVNPAGRMGIACAWVQRYDERFDPPAPQTDPVRTVPDLSSLADALLD
ncbi:MAG: haloacid dehalogenase type II [Salinibacter sp.]|uniref:haloacid dehalogenase type II n=1 Tax=Salinibacter sp. TaxID=2065818 RepID=UPI0035D3F26E